MTPTKQKTPPLRCTRGGANQKEVYRMSPQNDSPIYCRLTALHGMDPLAEAELVAEAEALLAQVSA